MLTQYVGDPSQDHALAIWWERLAVSGDLQTIFPAKDWALAPFLQRFRAPARCYYAADALGLWGVIWAAPWVGGAIPGLWVRGDKRRSKAALRAVEEGVGRLLEEWPVLVVITRSAARRTLYAHFGVTFTETPVPALFDGQAAWFGWLTADTFKRRVGAPIAGVCP